MPAWQWRPLGSALRPHTGAGHQSGPALLGRRAPPIGALTWGRPTPDRLSQMSLQPGALSSPLVPDMSPGSSQPPSSFTQSSSRTHPPQLCCSADGAEQKQESVLAAQPDMLATDAPPFTTRSSLCRMEILNCHNLQRHNNLFIVACEPVTEIKNHIHRIHVGETNPSLRHCHFCLSSFLNSESVFSIHLSSTLQTIADWG